jgi:hypothetical protein
MIKFFRKIRQQLLAENKFGKYVFYAIGEIALVVAGILIALQINNWNDLGKEQKLEIEILIEIQGNLKTDLDEHQANLHFIGQRLIASEKLLFNIKHDKHFNDTIAPMISFIAFAAPHANTVITGYKRMINSNGEIVSNDSLRAQISLIYENYYPWLSDIFKELFLTQTAYVNEIIVENFVIRESNSYMPIYEPENFRDLKNNTTLLTAIEAHMKYWEVIKGFYTEYLAEIEKVIISIDNELIRKG